jgi:UDP-hydrolysing UDP-N-acetyl-D-glucosamine 2-epimerase
MKHKICVITGTRAEFGLLYWLMKEIQDDPDLELQLIVTGAHLSSEFGLTYKEIEAAKFKIDEKVEILLSSDTAIGITKSVGLATISLAESFSRLNPELIIILGDRYEMLAAAQAAMFAKIPIAHIHGGEVTEGAFDEAIRHSISKMSSLHFVAAEPYRKRVIQLGELPERVFNFGAPGLDHIQKTELLDRDQLEKSIDFQLGETNFLVTYHPTTLQHQSTESAINALLEALDTFSTAHILFTGHNSDSEGRIIGERITSFIGQRTKRCRFFVSLGQLKYLSALKHFNIVIGNSSSGIIEAPFFKIPTVNIGNRQKGRLRAETIIDCREDSQSIGKAINLALSDKFKEKIKNATSPYGMGNASFKIKEAIKSFDRSQGTTKKFLDIPHSY